MIIFLFDLCILAQDAFLKLGKKLKLKRLNEYFGRISYMTTIQDPAENDLELKKKLDESNRKLHADLNAVKLINSTKYELQTEYAFCWFFPSKSLGNINNIYRENSKIC